MNSINIRKAGLADAADIAAVGRASFSDTFGPLFRRQEDLQQYLEKTYTEERVALSLSRPNNVFFLAHADGRTVGFGKMKKTSFHPVIPAATQSELQRIYVLRSSHGTGAGQALMDALTSEARRLQVDELWLDVHINNARAIRFYERNGFRMKGDHRFTIGTQLFDYYVMGKSFLHQ